MSKHVIEDLGYIKGSTDTNYLHYRSHQSKRPREAACCQPDNKVACAACIACIV